MDDVEAQTSAVLDSMPQAPIVAPKPRPSKYVPWRDRVKHFSWQWHGVVTATAVTSTVVHIFPYHNDSQALKIVALVIFLFGVVAFVFNCALKVAKIIMFPTDALTHVTDPSKSAFSGFLAVGGAGLIDAGVNVSKDWGTGQNNFLFFLYAMWWLDAVIAYATAASVVYFIVGQKSRDLSKLMAIWIVPAVALVASSTCGGLLASELADHFPNLALITTGFALTMGLIGLSFTTMITFGLLLRLFLHGAPDGMIVIGTFNALTPLGQGGFSLLINGANLSQLMPNHSGSTFAQSNIAGQLFFALCFGASYVCWCMGFAWILLSVISIARRWNSIPRFWISHWGLVFPNGTFALLSVQLGNVLESRFYHGFGAAWSILVCIAWTSLFIRSIPAFIDGTMFLPPPPKKSKKHRAIEAHRRQHVQQHHPHHLAHLNHPHPHGLPPNKEFDGSTLYDRDRSADSAERSPAQLPL